MIAVFGATERLRTAKTVSLRVPQAYFVRPSGSFQWRGAPKHPKRSRSRMPEETIAYFERRSPRGRAPSERA